MNGVLIASIYLPNGNPRPGPKFQYKLAWFERIIAHAAGLIAAGVPVVLAGDYNAVPTPQDIYSTRSLDDNALIQPESRDAFARMLDAAGKPVFSLLKDGSTHVHFYVFDLLMMSGKDVTGERW